MVKPIMILLYSQLFLWCIHNPVAAQAVKKTIIKKAETMQARKEYMLVVNQLAPYCATQRGREDTLALSVLADAYWMIRDFKNALSAYELLKRKVFFFTDQNKLRLADLYSTKSLYDSAISILKDVINAGKKIDGLINIKPFYRDSALWNLDILNLNRSDEIDMLPAVFKEQLYFLSSRLVADNTILNSWDMKGYLKLFVTPVNSYSDSVSVDTKQTDKGIITEKTYFTVTEKNKRRNSQDKNESVRHLSLFPDSRMSSIGSFSFCRIAQTDYIFFVAAESLTGKHNVEGNIWRKDLVSRDAQPERVSIRNWDWPVFNIALDTAGFNMVFSSKDSSGNGYDLFMARRVIGLIGPPVYDNVKRLGRHINTPFDEVFPTVVNGWLYFSSNGLPGMGNLDLFKIKMDYISDSSCCIPFNIGFPVNSAYDDFGLQVTNDNLSSGYFSTNRYGTDDILHFNHFQQTVELLVNFKIQDIEDDISFEIQELDSEGRVLVCFGFVRQLGKKRKLTYYLEKNKTYHLSIRKAKNIIQKRVLKVEDKSINIEFIVNAITYR